MCPVKQNSESASNLRRPGGCKASNPLPADGHAAGKNLKSDWQRERAALLHRACRSVQTRINHGERKRKAFRRVAKYHDGRSFKCDPKRRLALSEQTLRRQFAIWKLGGELRAAFKLDYFVRRPSVAAPVLVRFTNYCANSCQPSLKVAWGKFSARGGSFGSGGRSGKPLKVSYGQLRYNFHAADFYSMQKQLKAIQTEQTKLAQLRLKVIAEIRSRLPDRPPRRRVKREIDFQI